MQKDFTEEIKKHVKKEIKKLGKKQKLTLKALLFAGYKGEREELILELLNLHGIKKPESSPLTESFILQEESGKKVKYYRIKPEYYRAVREFLLKED